jgi:hypothetical protein
LPSNQPPIYTATPFIIPPPTLQGSFTPGAPTLLSFTETPTPIASPTPSPVIATDTLPVVQSVEVVILGCDTSLDVMHGMGEVTNAYVTVKNTGTVDLPNACGMLRANDEDREHPDKKVCLPNLPAQFQVNLKLTVDSAYKQDTIIQVDVLSNEVILLRVDRQSCRDIRLFGGVPGDVGVIEPIQP